MNTHENSPEIKSGPNPECSASRTFPLPGTTYYNMLYDPKARKYFPYRFQDRQPDHHTPLYKLRLLPLLGFGKLVLLLTTRGRKSGRLRDTPIGYFRYDNTIHLISGWGKEANWYKNILAHPDDVYIQVAFSPVSRPCRTGTGSGRTEADHEMAGEISHQWRGRKGDGLIQNGTTRKRPISRG